MTELEPSTAPGSEPANPRRGAALPERRVFIGASNVALGLPHLVELSAGHPVWAALGHGRSYGIPTEVFGRGLPSILESPIWSEFERLDDARPLHAWVTDVGNDIMYGISPEQLVEWVAEVVARLRALGARITLTRLPMESIRRLTPTRFRFFSRVLFPERRHEFEDVLAKVEAVDEALGSLVDSDPVELSPSWYGYDPIHIRRSQRHEAWRQLLGAPEPAPPSTLRQLRLRFARPQEWTWLGQPRRTSQPVRTFSSGTTLHLF